jgi:multidrug efflux pump subunit AcrB
VILSDLSIKKPVFAWMLMIGLIAFGAVGFDRMGVSQLPDVDFPVLTVSIDWEGAAPEVIETEITDVIEDAVMSVQGIQEVSSTSRQGNARVTLEFDLSKDIDVALQEVQSKLAQAQRLLPREADPAVVSKSNPEDQPIMWLAVSGDKPRRDLMEYVRDNVRDRFTTVPGVAEVFLGGYVEPNLRVWLDAEKLRARELAAEDILRAIEAQHAEVPAGRIETGRQELNVRVLGEGRHGRGIPSDHRSRAQRVAHLSNDPPGRRRGRGGRFGRRATDFPGQRRAGRGTGHSQAARGERRGRGEGREGTHGVGPQRPPPRV